MAAAIVQWLHAAQVRRTHNVCWKIATITRIVERMCMPSLEANKRCHICWIPKTRWTLGTCVAAGKIAPFADTSLNPFDVAPKIVAIYFQWPWNRIKRQNKFSFGGRVRVTNVIFFIPFSAAVGLVQYFVHSQVSNEVQQIPCNDVAPSNSRCQLTRGYWNTLYL